MNVDHILETFSARQVRYILIGGMNFLLRHAPVLTYDVDLWIDDSAENLDRCEQALAHLQAEWGPSEKDWGPVARRPRGWLTSQSVFCLTSPHGAVDIFKSVKGLGSWAAARAKASVANTAAGIPFVGLSDEDMLRCQLALPEGQRNQQRIQVLNVALGKRKHGSTDR